MKVIGSAFRISEKGVTAMIGQMTGQLKPGSKNPLGSAWEKRATYGMRREEIMQAIDGLYVQSRRGLWRVLLFLGISAVALYFRSFDLFAVLPEELRELIGAPPPLELIHIVLAVSTISALVLIAGRGSEKPGGSLGWLQFAMSAFFYPLYATASSLETWFPAVLAAGLIVLVADHFATWSQTSRAIQEEKERLGRMT